MSPFSKLRTTQNRPGSSSWRIWLIAGYLAIVMVFVALWVAFVFSPMGKQLEDQQTENLKLAVQSCAIAFENSPSAQAFIEEAVQGTGMRLSVIASDGTVLADSSSYPAEQENHLQREEVQEALQGEVGVARRVSTTNNEESIYVATAVTYQGEEVVVRLSEPLSTFELVNTSLRNSALFLVGLSIVFAIVIALVSLRQTSTPFRRLEQVRTDLVANASHELKTPVAGIRLLSEAITDAAESNDTEALKLFTERLGNESERMQRLVVDLLDLSRLETQEKSDKTPRADLHSTLVASFMVHKVEAEDKGLEITLVDRSRPSDNCYASMEPSDASLIFDNLIENAIMYTDEGTIIVTFENNPREIEVSIQDTGIGIPQADQSRIFERFYRVDKARSREVGGTGLGLSLVRHAVERAGGAISLKSELGRGSLFVVTIPKRIR